MRERLYFVAVRPLGEVRAERSRALDIRVNLDLLTDEALDRLKGLIESHPGPCRTFLRLEIPARSETVVELGDGFKVAASDDLLARVDHLFGGRVATLR
jgi:hypothetical protein